MHLVSCHHSHCIGIIFIKLASIRVPPVLSVVSSEPRHTRTRPRHLRNIILLVAQKCSRNGLQLVVRSYYSVDRPPAKFRRIRSPFDSPTVKYIAARLPVPSSDVFGLRKLLLGCLLFSPLSPTPLHSPPKPPSDRNHRISIRGSETLQNPQP